MQTPPLAAKARRQRYENRLFNPTILQDSSPEAVEMLPVLTELLGQMLGKPHPPKPSEVPAYQALRKQGVAYQNRVVLALAAAIIRANDRMRDNRVTYALDQLFEALLRNKLTLTEADYLHLFAGGEFNFTDHSQPLTKRYAFPTMLLLNQVSKLAQAGELGPPMRAFLTQLRNGTASYAAQGQHLHLKVQEILDLNNASADLPVVAFYTTDPLGQALQDFATALDPAAPATRPWLHLLRSWKGTTAGQPTAKQVQEMAADTAAIGPDAVRRQCAAWLALLVAAPIVEQKHPANQHNVVYSDWHYLDFNLTEAKGLVWTLGPLADAPVLAQLAALVAKCFRKMPGKGPIAIGLGNAALLALSQGGLPGVAALARVRSSSFQSNTLALIARYIAEESARLGVSPEEIEDLSLPDFGLTTGRLVEELGDYTATLKLVAGKAALSWAEGDKPLKSAPAALKASHPDELKALKAAQIQAQQTYVAQRERLDRSFVDERRIAWPWFEQYYLSHGLLGELVRPLIWRLHQPDGSVQNAIYQDNTWLNAQGQPVPAPTAATEVQLWHPVLVPAAEVLAWRELLEARQLRQPIKQAFREVYLLTPPEERTRLYSNRMAAHLLKQQQFNSLTKLRGWSYGMLGAYDKGYNTTEASRLLPRLGLVAEYSVREVSGEGGWNQNGMYHYISTDQVRFVRGGQPVPLPEIPPLVFSEVMRDVDLFVGVASVGNDPTWRDGGLLQYHGYWESYSFGDLTEVAKTRKLALERLVPRLKIGKVSEIRGNFLEVQGTRHRYKIHLGSGNILMADGDRYLCIVPGRSASPALDPAGVFLPFEGDAVLSIILSKAQLLMHDDKITDETILRQL